jgi:hypothetical protein
LYSHAGGDPGFEEKSANTFAPGRLSHRAPVQKQSGRIIGAGIIAFVFLTGILRSYLFSTTFHL